jgi:hypothetical protein
MIFDKFEFQAVNGAPTLLFQIQEKYHYYPHSFGNATPPE